MRRMFKHSLKLLILILFVSKHSYAQQNDTQEWNRLIIQKALDSEKKYSLYMEFQQRFADNVSKNERYVLRPGLTYSPNKSLSFTVGYAWLDSNYQSSSKHEMRPWQQVSYKTVYGPML